MQSSEQDKEPGRQSVVDVPVAVEDGPAPPGSSDEVFLPSGRGSVDYSTSARVEEEDSAAPAPPAYPRVGTHLHLALGRSPQQRCLALGSPVAGPGWTLIEYMGASPCWLAQRWLACVG